MSGRGGKRPGAGRKPSGLRHVVKAESPIRQAELRLAANLPKLIDIALDHAFNGDKALLIYCIDRVLGRTIQPISIESQVDEIAADFGVPSERVTSIVERLKARKAG